MAEDLLEVHHRDGDRNNNQYAHLVLLHGHCHDVAHATPRICDKDPCAEEPDDTKGSRPVQE